MLGVMWCGPGVLFTRRTHASPCVPPTGVLFTHRTHASPCWVPRPHCRCGKVFAYELFKDFGFAPDYVVAGKAMHYGAIFSVGPDQVCLLGHCFACPGGPYPPHSCGLD